MGLLNNKEPSIRVRDPSMPPWMRVQLIALSRVCIEAVTLGLGV